MDEKTLKDFTKKRSELIASLMSSMDGQVKDNQKKLLEKVLEKFGLFHFQVRIIGERPLTGHTLNACKSFENNSVYGILFGLLEGYHGFFGV